MRVALSRRGIAITVGAYVAMWAATQVFGVPSVSAYSFAEAAIPPESLRISKEEVERVSEKAYYLNAFAPAPFVVLLEIGASCGPSCHGSMGMGYEYVYGWLPGKAFLLRAHRSWIT